MGFLLGDDARLVEKSSSSGSKNVDLTSEGDQSARPINNHIASQRGSFFYFIKEDVEKVPTRNHALHFNEQESSYYLGSSIDHSSFFA